MLSSRNDRPERVSRVLIAERLREPASDERPTLRRTSRFRDHDDEEPEATRPSTARYLRSR